MTFREEIQIDSLKLTNEELAHTVPLDYLNEKDIELLRDTVFELSKLLYSINDITDETDITKRYRTY